jgi:hypothetical protein
MVTFVPGKRRKINLGGAKSVVFQTDLSHRAKSRRTEREEIRRRRGSARCIQSCRRSFQQSRAVKRILEERFQEDVLGLNGMRALVLIRRNELLLAQWSEAVIHAGNGKPWIHLNQGVTCAPFPTRPVPSPLLFRRPGDWTRLTHFPSSTGWPLQYVSGPGLDHWVALIQRVALLLLFSIANSPRCVPSSPVACTAF